MPWNNNHSSCRFDAPTLSENTGINIFFRFRLGHYRCSKNHRSTCMTLKATAADISAYWNGSCTTWRQRPSININHWLSLWRSSKDPYKWSYNWHPSLCTVTPLRQRRTICLNVYVSRESQSYHSYRETEFVHLVKLHKYIAADFAETNQHELRIQLYGFLAVCDVLNQFRLAEVSVDCNQADCKAMFSRAREECCWWSALWSNKTWLSVAIDNNQNIYYFLLISRSNCQLCN